MQTVDENIEIAAEERVLRELAAVLKAEIALSEVVATGSDEEWQERISLSGQRAALEAKVLCMKPITKAGKLMRTLIGLSRADAYLNDGDRDDDAPEGVGDGVWQFMHEAAARLTGEGARVLALALEWYALPQARLRPAEAIQGLRRALGARLLQRSRPGRMQLTTGPAA